MESLKTKSDFVSMILEDQDINKMEEEELVHLLLEEKISKNVNMINNENSTVGEKMSDNIAKFAGSWPFIIIFISCIAIWIMINVIAFSKSFDPYPFILLNLILSCVAAIQAPVIMMSQNRQEKKDRIRAENDYKTNLKAEIIIEDLHQKIDLLLLNQAAIISKTEE